MRFLRSALPIVIAIAVLTIGQAAAGSVAPQRRTRVVVWSPLTALSDVIQADDDIVELVSPFEDPFPDPHPLSVSELVRRFTGRAAVVAVVQVRDSKGELDLQGVSPQTRLSVQIRDVLRVSTRFHAHKGDVLDVVMFGGEVTVGRVTVRMGLHGGDMSELPAGQYVMFLEQVDGVMEAFHTPTLVQGQRLIYPRFFNQPPHRPNPLSQLSFDELKRLVRNAPRNTGPVGL